MSIGGVFELLLPFGPMRLKRESASVGCKASSTITSRAGLVIAASDIIIDDSAPSDAWEAGTQV